MQRYTNKNLRTIVAHFRLTSELEEFAHTSGLSLDAFLILLLVEFKQTLTAGEAANLSGFSRAKTTRCLKQLASLGFTEERLVASDYRKCHISLTRGGLATVHDANKSYSKDAIRDHLHRSFNFSHARITVGTLSPIPLGDTVGRILLVLGLFKEGMSQSELCSLCHLPQPRTSMSCAKLEEEGLLKKSPFQDHPNQTILTLSMRGKQLADSLLHESKF